MKTTFSKGETLYGAPVADPATSASVLRAKAAAAGVALEEANAADLAAAVIAADLWMLTTHADSLASPVTFGPDAVVVLAAILSRAAGVAEKKINLSERCATSTKVLLAAEAYVEWAYTVLDPQDAEDALLRAASDLCAAGPTSRFAAAAEVLRVTADREFFEEYN